MLPKMPEWLSSLKSGQYTLSEIAEITGQRKTNICKYMTIFNVTKKMKEQNIYRNLHEVIYFWDNPNKKH